MVPVRRRDFIKFILGSAAAWPLPLRAQQATKGYRIGYMGAASHAEYAREIEALLKGLRQLGYPVQSLEPIQPLCVTGHRAVRPLL
jgi:aspartate aminotransferase-like enzyme